MKAAPPNAHPVWIAGAHGPAHLAGPRQDKTVCRLDMAGLIRVKFIAAYIAGTSWCVTCFPESARLPGWPMGRSWR